MSIIYQNSYHSEITNMPGMIQTFLSISPFIHLLHHLLIQKIGLKAQSLKNI